MGKGKFDFVSKVRTVKELKEWLVQFPDSAYIYAYSGEGTGIVVKLDKELGWLETAEYYAEVL